MIDETGRTTFVVVPDDGEPYEVSTDLRDIRLWERVNPRNTMRKLAENASADDIFSFTYIAIKRQKLRDVPPMAEWIDTTYIYPKQKPTVSGLDRSELAGVIDKSLNYPDVTPEIIADHVMDFLEALPGQQPDPTQRGQ